jgi:hypothetical protein
MMIQLDGSAAVPVSMPVAPVQLPRRPGVLVDAYPEPKFILTRQQPTDIAATQLAEDHTARVLVACPSLVSPARSWLALAVGRILTDEREARGAGPIPIVTCGVRPRCGWESGGIIVPHPVTVFTRGSAQYRVVWEVTHAGQIAKWRTGLDRYPA